MCIRDRGNSAAVKIHQAPGKGISVDQFAGILLDMDPGDADPFGVPFFIDDGIQISALAEGHIVLGNLIRLGQIGIKIVFAVRFARCV